MAEITGAPFLIYSQVTTSERIRFGEGPDALDFRFKTVLQSGNETLIHQTALEGLGFAFLPRWLASDDIENGRLERVMPEFEWPKVPLYAIYPDRSYLPSKVRSFLDFLAGPKGLEVTLQDA